MRSLWSMLELCKHMRVSCRYGISNKDRSKLRFPQLALIFLSDCSGRALARPKVHLKVIGYCKTTKSGCYETYENSQSLCPLYFNDFITQEKYIIFSYDTYRACASKTIPSVTASEWGRVAGCVYRSVLVLCRSSRFKSLSYVPRIVSKGSPKCLCHVTPADSFHTMS